MAINLGFYYRKITRRAKEDSAVFGHCPTKEMFVARTLAEEPKTESSPTFMSSGDIVSAAQFFSRTEWSLSDEVKFLGDIKLP